MKDGSLPKGHVGFWKGEGKKKQTLLSPFFLLLSQSCQERAEALKCIALRGNCFSFLPSAKPFLLWAYPVVAFPILEAQRGNMSACPQRHVHPASGCSCPAETQVSRGFGSPWLGRLGAASSAVCFLRPSWQFLKHIKAGKKSGVVVINDSKTTSLRGPVPLRSQRSWEVLRGCNYRPVLYAEPELLMLICWHCKLPLQAIDPVTFFSYR